MNSIPKWITIYFISALSVQNRTCARTASNLSMDRYAVQEAGTLEENVLAFLNNHNILFYLLILCLMLHIAGILIIVCMH